MLAGIRLNVFEKLDQKNGDAMSSSELAKMTGADSCLMGAWWHFPFHIVICIAMDADSLPRTVIESSGSDGQYLRNRCQ